MAVKSKLTQGGDGTAIASGMVGEIIEYSGAATAMTTNQWNDCGCAPVVLGVGIWDLQAQCYFNPTSGSTVSSQYIIGIGTVTGNDGTGVLNTNSSQLVNQTSGGNAANFSTPLVRVRVTSGTVSYYPKAFASFTVSGVQGTAYIRARRVA